MAKIKDQLERDPSWFSSEVRETNPEVFMAGISKICDDYWKLREEEKKDDSDQYESYFLSEYDSRMEKMEDADPNGSFDLEATVIDY